MKPSQRRIGGGGVAPGMMGKPQEGLIQEAVSKLSAATRDPPTSSGAAGPAAAHARAAGLSAFPLPAASKPAAAAAAVPRSFQAPSTATDQDRVASERGKAALAEERDQLNAAHKKRMAELDCELTICWVFYARARVRMGWGETPTFIFFLTIFFRHTPHATHPPLSPYPPHPSLAPNSRAQAAGHARQ